MRKRFLRQKERFQAEMAQLCCGLWWKKENDTKVVSLRGLEPERWHDRLKNSKVRAKYLKWLRPSEYGQRSAGRSGQETGDDWSYGLPSPDVLQVGLFNPDEPMRQNFMSTAPSETTQPEAIQLLIEEDARSLHRTPSPLFAASRPVGRESDQQPVLSRAGVSDGIHTDVRGAPPMAMPWKELYADVLKPREQMMSLYRAAADKNAQRDPAGPQNSSPATPDDAAEPGRARTPHRESKLQALKAQLRRKLINRRRRPKAARSRERKLETVVSDSEEGDEDDEILYRVEQYPYGAADRCNSSGDACASRPTSGRSVRDLEAQSTSSQASRASGAQPIKGVVRAGDQRPDSSGNEQEPAKAAKGNALTGTLKKITEKSGREDPSEGAWAESSAPGSNTHASTSSVGIQGPPDHNMASGTGGAPRVRTILVQEMPSTLF